MLPINFNDLTVRIFPQHDEKYDVNTPEEKYQVRFFNNRNGILLHFYFKNNTNLDGDSFKENESKSNERPKSEPRYISLEESSCVLDIALLANEPVHRDYR